VASSVLTSAIGLFVIGAAIHDLHGGSGVAVGWPPAPAGPRGGGATFGVGKLIGMAMTG